MFKQILTYLLDAYTIKYFGIAGRANRLEYWSVTLFSHALFYIALLVDIYLITIDYTIIGYGVFSSVFGVIVFIACIFVSIRRLHDVNRSGWFWLLILIPYIGFAIMILLGLPKGNATVNYYGSPTPSYKKLIQAN